MVRQIVRNNERIVENDMNEGGRLGMNPMDATMVRTMNDDDDDEDDVFVDEGLETADRAREERFVLFLIFLFFLFFRVLVKKGEEDAANKIHK